MCVPEACPWASVCDERLQFDAFVVDERMSEAEAAAANLATLASQFQGDRTERAIEGIKFLRPAMHARGAVREARERQSVELALQQREVDTCKGAKPQQRFRFIGKITGMSCGSRTRNARLNPRMPDSEQIE